MKPSGGSAGFHSCLSAVAITAFDLCCETAPKGVLTSSCAATHQHFIINSISSEGVRFGVASTIARLRLLNLNSIRALVLELVVVVAAAEVLPFLGLRTATDSTQSP